MWCDRRRCGYLVPPIMSHMPRRHVGSSARLGTVCGAGLVIVHLVASHGQPPLIGLHAAGISRIAGTVELPLPDAWQLARRLDHLLADAGYTPPTQEATDEQ